MIELTLPWPQSVNHYKKLGCLTRTKTGKLYQPRINSDLTKRFYYEVWVRIRTYNTSKNAISLHREAITLGVSITLHPPDKRRRDIDNGIKLILDSLVRGGLIKDDSQIARLYVERRDIISHGQVIVRISELTHEHQ